jgi:carbon-monoxide dehydrogenase small subunit
VLSSNLCRCTGYQNIIKAVRAARDEMRASVPGPGAVAPSTGTDAGQQDEAAPPELLAQN